MRIFVFFFLLLMGLIGYLALLNQGSVTLHLPKENTVEIPTVAFLLLSMAFGGIIVVLGVGVRETKNLLLNWKSSRVHKKETKIHDLYTEAVNAFLGKRNRDALALFQKILVLNPNHVNTLLRLGTIQRMEKNFPEAIRLHRKARGLDEQNIEILLALGRDYEQALRFDEAIQALRDVLKLDATNLTALTHLRDLFVQLERWEDAHEVQEKIVKGHLSESDANREQVVFLGIKYELGRYYSKKGFGDRARRFLKGAIKLDRSFLPAYIGLGEIYLDEKKPQDAAELLEKAYDITHNIIVLHRLEQLYLEMNAPEQIIRIYQDAFQKDPSNKVLRFFLGKLYYRLEMVDDAFDILAELESAEERFPDLHKILGNLYLRRGQLDLAVEAFKKALNLKKMVIIPYYCPECDYHTHDWSGRCFRCGGWNTYIATPIITTKKMEPTNPEPLKLSRISYN